jgi:hypothetical protein
LIFPTKEKTGFPNFANKTFANWTFANGESPAIYWRKYSGHSPIGESLIGKIQVSLLCALIS